ncbi:unnamed protein product [Moneuplotes crassus]|uniref:Uncharacterized protein n=1 Tax=Euplotes crassus TaxID=5936 RepID=A0AAD1U8J7_EUPCR|nr:unnamed protein product [Moneuplotes crassus]
MISSTSDLDYFFGNDALDQDMPNSNPPKYFEEQNSDELRPGLNLLQSTDTTLKMLDQTFVPQFVKPYSAECVSNSEKNASEVNLLEINSFEVPCNEDLTLFKDDVKMEGSSQIVLSCSDGSKPSSPKENGIREDSLYKSSIRQMRKFYRDLFKDNNRNIVRRRYKNCKTRQIYEKLHSTLEKEVLEGSLTPDLVYFTMGIIDIRKTSHLPCSQACKLEISLFLELTRRFSKKRLRNALRSENLRTLCWTFVKSRDNCETSILHRELEVFDD